jgi:phospholipid/cholesterol/gamma-HCH transport system permease protein
MMTAIFVAGRSGSAFAAEIAHDGQRRGGCPGYHGFRTGPFSSVSQVIAAMIVVALLTLYAMLFGILGGVIVGLLAWI